MAEEIIDSEDGIVTDLIPQENIDIRSMIYTIRGQQVMLDFELAELYGYTTTRFNEQVTNNLDKRNRTQAPFANRRFFDLDNYQFINITNIHRVKKRLIVLDGS